MFTILIALVVIVWAIRVILKELDVKTLLKEKQNKD